MNKREIDAKVAKAMGICVHDWHRIEGQSHGFDWDFPGICAKCGKTESITLGDLVDSMERVPHYSTSIEAACVVWDALPWPKYYTRLVQTDMGNWRFDIEANGGDGPVYSASAETRPLAICLAFLKARGVEVEE